MDDHGSDEPLERRLRDDRPRPDAFWQLALREELFPARPVPLRRRLPRLRAPMVAAGAGFATVAFVVAGVLGGGPLGGLADEPVTAKDDCRVVTVMRPTRLPRLVQTATGPEIRYRVARRPVRVKRCD